jgi:ribonuclease T2
MSVLLRLGLLLSLLLSAPAWAKGGAQESFSPSRDVDAVDQPLSAKAVGHLKAGASYSLLKRGGPGGNWCKVQVESAAGWVLCSEAGAPAAPSAPAGPAAPSAGARAAFDYYLLTLSWSPSFCEEKGSRSPEQCGAGRHYAFVVHGLWPQNEKGWPESCASGDRPSKALVGQMLDLMPSRQLIAHEWEKHGTCSGLSAGDYFAALRKAYGSIHIPAAYLGPKAAFTTDLASIKQAFEESNPGITDEMFAVACKGELDEVRLCLDRELKPRRCSREVRDTCKGQVRVPPMR